jgi:hypothetical protein
MGRGQPKLFRPSGDRNLPRLAGVLVAAMVAVSGVSPRPARADNFAQVYYSARTDQLVVTMAYRGTNPDHTFSLKWGTCQTLDGGGPGISADVLDSQWQDVEKKSFQKTTRFSLADLPCRPVTVTLRSAPRFFTTVQIPAKRNSNP